MPQLLASDAEGGARHSARNECHIPELSRGLPRADIGVVNPRRPAERFSVVAERPASIGVVFDEREVLESSLVEADRLPAGPGADFD